MLLVGWTVGVIVALITGEWARAAVGAAMVAGFATLWLGPASYMRAVRNREKGTTSRA
jgi:hypothetical protein